MGILTRAGRPGPNPGPAERSILEAAGLAIDNADSRCWRVTGPDKGAVFLYWPELRSWRSEDGKRRGYGPTTLVAMMRSPVQKPDEPAKPSV